MKTLLRFLVVSAIALIGNTGFAETFYLYEDTVTGSDIVAEKAQVYSETPAIIKPSGAIYFAQAAYSPEEYIQLRSNYSNSGIVTTTSYGTFKKLYVEWGVAGGTETADGRTLLVYGKNTPYSSSADLYDSGTAGTMLGEIVKGTSSSLTVSDNYKYVGIRSKSGAIYANYYFQWYSPGVALGDVDNSGIIDVTDVVLLANYVMGDTVQGINLSVANIDGNGTIDVTDVVLLAEIVMGK